MDFEFRKDAFYVTLDRPIADAERVGDFFDEVALAQERQDFVFAWGEFSQFPEGRPGRQ